MAKNNFQYGGWNSYTLQCGTIMALFSPGDCTLQCGMWLWNRDSEFTKWQHPAMWQVALGWHAIEFAQTSAILEFYIWFRFPPLHRTRHVILHQSLKFYPNRTTLGRRKWRHVDFPDGGSQPYMFSRFDRIQACVGRTEGRTDEQPDRYTVSARAVKRMSYLLLNFGNATGLYFKVNNSFIVNWRWLWYCCCFCCYKTFKLWPHSSVLLSIAISMCTSNCIFS